MSVDFTREVSAETAAESSSGRPISPHPNWVTASGLEALTNAMRESRLPMSRAADRGRRRTSSRCRVASRDMRYFADRLRTAQLVPPPAEFSAVAFGHRVAFRRGDGRLRGSGSSGKTKRILGMDQFRTSPPSRGL